MKMRHLAAGLAAVGALAAGGVLTGVFETTEAAETGKRAKPVASAASADSYEYPEVVLPWITDLPPLNPVVLLPEITDLPDPVIKPETAADLHPEPWSREIESGETLDVILMEAGLTAAERAEAAQAIGKEYDLRRLRPGHEVTVEVEPDGQPARVALDVSGGTMIQAVLGDDWDTIVLQEEATIETVAKEARVQGSISATLGKAGIPSSFAVVMAQALGSKVNFRRELRGGEVLRMMWDESRITTGRVGQPKLGFASLDLRGRLYEVIWKDSAKPLVFENGEVVRVFSKPVSNARLSSRFGMRTDPMDGDRRMHSGIDFAAAHGTPIYATAPGTVLSAGDRGGYGIMIEISHGSGVTTRYAHLSKLASGIKKGARVEAGDTIGRVGSTGKSTGPHLHYEVRVKGRATDPLADDRLAEAIRKGDMDAEARAALKTARAAVGEHLTTEVAGLAQDAH